MRKLILIAVIAGAWLATSTTNASAVVCAKGAWHAGCAGPHGAVTARRTVGGGAVVKNTRVYPRAGVAVQRRGVVRY